MRQSLIAGLLCLALLALFLGHLIDPGALLAARDIPIFHLPLATALQEAFESGLPTWNPGIHGGQPILSNPNYAAFYPPRWLLLVVPAHYAISLIVLLHAVLGFFGARRLALRLGCSPGPALLAATGFAFGGAALATTNLLTTYCGLAWLPWILAGCDRCLEDEGGAWLSKRSLFPAFAFALQILAGEPVTVLTTGVAAGILALAKSGRRGLRIKRLAVVCALATLFATTQLLPTYLRIAETPRAGGLDPESSLEWSTAPQRLLELVLPRAWGDPMRIDEGLYFGWRLHDQQYPYLTSIYSGHLVLVLALGAVTLWKVRYRSAWVAMLLGGCFLAFGSHNPVLTSLARFIPILSLIRYPEKFLLLTTSALVFAAALGWQRILDAREEKRPALEDFPLALSALVTIIHLSLIALLWARPDLGAWFARTHSAVQPGPELLQRATLFFRAEAVAGLAAAASATAVFALHRWRRVPRNVLVPLTLLVLIADLSYYNRSLTPTVTAARLLEPPEALRALDPTEGRVFVERAFTGPLPVIVRSSRPGPATLWDQYENAEPYLANLWGFSYALNRDFDLMATAPVTDALGALTAAWGDTAATSRILGSWSVRHLIRGRPLEEIVGERLSGAERGHVVAAENPGFRQRHRFETEITVHPDPTSATEADRSTGFRSAHWISTSNASLPKPSFTSARILEVSESSAHSRVLYRADGIAPLTVARTFHPGWRAGVDGRPTTVYRTSLGMMGIIVPPGEHVLELRFREPATLPSVAISILALTAALSSCAFRGRRTATSR